MSIKETCHCGSVEFTLQNDPMMHFACHCSDCQKIWGNSFFGYAYSTDDISITGEVKKYSYEVGAAINCITFSAQNVAAKFIRSPT
jgi:hypothetical protein